MPAMLVLDCTGSHSALHMQRRKRHDNDRRAYEITMTSTSEENPLVERSTS